MDYPSNSQSNKRRPRREDRPKVQKVVTGRVMTKKRSFLARVFEAGPEQESGSVTEWIVDEVIIPALKDLFFDTVEGALSKKLYGNSRGRRRPTRDEGSVVRGGAVVPYHKMSKSTLDRNDVIPRRNRGPHFDEIYLETRPEAEEVLDLMMELIERYDEVTVADLYDMVGMTADFPQEAWGWVDLRNAGISRVPNRGYKLVLPRPIELD